MPVAMGRYVLCLTILLLIFLPANVYGHLLIFKYDLAGKQKKVISLPDIPAKRAETQYQYEGTRQWKITDARNNTTQFLYDAVGRTLRTQFPSVSPYGPSYTHTEFDSFGRRVAQSDQITEDDYDLEPLTK